MNELVSIIGNVGFPIVMCLLLFSEVRQLRSVIENNTLVIMSLKDKLEAAEREEQHNDNQ